MASLRLVPLAMAIDSQYELGLVDARILDADRFARSLELAHELPDGPPVLVPIAELVCRSTGEGHT